MRDRHWRSIVKALVYKGGSIVLLALLSWLFTKDLAKMSLITVCYQIITVVGYYIHERIWEKVKWGRGG